MDVNDSKFIKALIVCSDYSIKDISQLLYPGDERGERRLYDRFQNETLRYNEAVKIAEILGKKINWLDK